MMAPYVLVTSHLDKSLTKKGELLNITGWGGGPCFGLSYCTRPNQSEISHAKLLVLNAADPRACF